MEEVYSLMNSFFKELDIFTELPHGKGVRAKLILLISNNTKLAAIVESIHLASLLHDDVIDEATLRRGRESINSKYGDFTSVMVGDILYSKAFYELLSLDNEVAKIVSLAVNRLSYGEYQDVNLSKFLNLDEDKYMKMIYNKTASLIEASCEASAIIAGYDRKDFATYGRNLGLIFQIIDDLLDITASEDQFGKNIFNDLKEGKMTLPYIYLYKSLDIREQDYFKTLYKKHLSKEEKEWILFQMKKYNIFDKLYLEVDKLKNEAIESIKKYNNYKLLEIIEKLVYRSY